MKINLSRTPLAQVAFAAVFSAAAVTAAQAQVTARDDAASPLRAPTAAESQALQPAARSGPAVGMITGRVNPQPVRYKNGSVGQELDASTMMYTVARRNADGSISQYCVEGPDAAQHVIHGTGVTHSKGHQHELK